MSITVLVIVAVFLCVAAVVGAMVMMFRPQTSNAIEDRLDQLTGAGGNLRDGKKSDSRLLTRPMDEVSSSLVGFFNRVLNLRTFLEQAGSSMEPAKFLSLVAVLAAVGAGACILIPQLPLALAPVLALVLGVGPFGWLYFKRKRRLKAFGKQLPEALELIARALRAGHSLASGLHLVATEMADPIRREFSRCYDEQNLGIPLEEALEDLADRVPNLDLRFFVTAVNLQRQTGGDLSEILDKIGTLVRQRFQIWGQVQALTGEGRLSGIVLLALPPVLFLVILKMNPTYIMKLFNEPLGHKMLAVAVAMQIMGALVIKKIVNIKV